MAGRKLASGSGGATKQDPVRVLFEKAILLTGIVAVVFVIGAFVLTLFFPMSGNSASDIAAIELVTIVMFLPPIALMGGLTFIFNRRQPVAGKLNAIVNLASVAAIAFTSVTWFLSFMAFSGPESYGTSFTLIPLLIGLGIFSLLSLGPTVFLLLAILVGAAFQFWFSGSFLIPGSVYGSVSKPVFFGLFEIEAITLFLLLSSFLLLARGLLAKSKPQVAEAKLGAATAFLTALMMYYLFYGVYMLAFYVKYATGVTPKALSLPPEPAAFVAFALIWALVVPTLVYCAALLLESLRAFRTRQITVIE